MEGDRSVSTSILERLKVRESAAWSQVMRLFYPLVFSWCRKAGLQDEDASDVCQEVFRALAGNVDRFDRDHGRNSFRGWLRGITKRQLLAFWRRRQCQGEGGTTAQKRLAEVPEPFLDEASAADLRADKHVLLGQALSLVRGEVEEHTWQAFWRVVVDGRAPADVAAELNISVNTVYLAKGRLLRRLREEFGELIL